MKKIIASAALVTTLLGSSTAVFAETTTTTTTAPVTTSAPAVTTTANTTTSTDTTANTTTTTTSTDTTANTTTTADTTADTTTETTAETNLDTTAVVLPEAGLTPDKLFYSLKLWIEQIKVLVTTDAATKADLLQQQAETRLAEAKAMAEAGKMDLAEQAMNEAKAKLEAAQKAIEAANATNKDITKLTATVDASQEKFAVVLTDVLAKAPEEVQDAMAPVVAELLVQVAVNNDTANPEEAEAVEEEADKVVEETQVEIDLSGLQPRMILVLNAMAEASGKDFAEVVSMYKAHPGLGVLAKQLGVHMGAVQHAAQGKWKSGGKIEIEIKAPVVEEPAVEVTTETTTAVEAQPTTTKLDLSGVKIEWKSSDRDDDDRDEDDRDEDDEDDDDDKEHGKSNGRGNGKAFGHDKGNNGKGKGKN